MQSNSPTTLSLMGPCTVRSTLRQWRAPEVSRRRRRDRCHGSSTSRQASFDANELRPCLLHSLLFARVRGWPRPAHRGPPGVQVAGQEGPLALVERRQIGDVLLRHRLLPQPGGSGGAESSRSRWLEPGADRSAAGRRGAAREGSVERCTRRLHALHPDLAGHGAEHRGGGVAPGLGQVRPAEAVADDHRHERIRRSPPCVTAARLSH